MNPTKPHTNCLVVTYFTLILITQQAIALTVPLAECGEIPTCLWSDCCNIGEYICNRVDTEPVQVLAGTTDYIYSEANQCDGCGCHTPCNEAPPVSGITCTARISGTFNSETTTTVTAGVEGGAVITAKLEGSVAGTWGDSYSYDIECSVTAPPCKWQDFSAAIKILDNVKYSVTRQYVLSTFVTCNQGHGNRNEILKTSDIATYTGTGKRRMSTGNCKLLNSGDCP
jgi:hypothetical protein